MTIKRTVIFVLIAAYLLVVALFVLGVWGEGDHYEADELKFQAPLKSGSSITSPPI